MRSTGRWGLRHRKGDCRALRECARAAAGGRLVVSISRPVGVLALYRAYSRLILPRLGGWISGDRAAYAYLPASVARFPTPAEFGALMESAGFTSVRGQPLTGGIAHVFAGERR